MKANVFWENTECGGFCFGRHKREWINNSEEKTSLAYSTTCILCGVVACRHSTLTADLLLAFILATDDLGPYWGRSLARHVESTIDSKMLTRNV